VQKAEEFLLGLVEPPELNQPQPFPLPQLDNAVPAAEQLMEELRDSWNCHQQHPEATVVREGALEALMTGPFTLVSERNTAVCNVSARAALQACNRTERANYCCSCSLG
jgi:hypothetical protein